MTASERWQKLCETCDHHEDCRPCSECIIGALRAHAAEERERCAKVAEGLTIKECVHQPCDYEAGIAVGKRCIAAAIRALDAGGGE